MTVRNARKTDIGRIGELLCQVNNVHAEGRPDIFKFNMRKYTDAQLEMLLEDERMFIFVAVDEMDVCQGYAFCQYNVVEEGSNLHSMTSIYIDDICVDASMRGNGVGTLLYEYVIEYAKNIGCYNVTLNVWSFNTSAMKFYEKCGMKPLKTVMETVLEKEAKVRE